MKRRDKAARSSGLRDGFVAAIRPLIATPAGMRTLLRSTTGVIVTASTAGLLSILAGDECLEPDVEFGSAGKAVRLAAKHRKRNMKRNEAQTSQASYSIRRYNAGVTSKLVIPLVLGSRFSLAIALPRAKKLFAKA